MILHLTRPRRLALAVPSLLLALSLAGCGDDGDDGGSGAGGADVGGGSSSATEESPAPAKADFVADANDICATGNAELATAGAEVNPTDPDAIPMFASEVLVPSVRGQIEDIRALGFPEGDEELLDGVLTDASAAVDVIEGNPEVLATGPNPFEEVNVALDDYGLTECGSE